MDENTSQYWRKYLKLDEPVDISWLKKYHSYHEVFRPFLFFMIDLLARFYFRIEVHGLENIPELPYILAPNHCSALDQPVVSWAIKRKKRKDLYSLATKFFYDNAFTRFFMKVDANIIRIDPVKDYMPAIQAACKVLKLGKSIYVNPEGTRSDDGELLPFKTGVGVIAVETGAPIVPIYIVGTFKSLPPFALFPRPAKIRVYFEKPVFMKEYVDQKKTSMAYDVYKSVTDELYRRIKSLKEKHGN